MLLWQVQNAKWIQDNNNPNAFMKSYVESDQIIILYVCINYDNKFHDKYVNMQTAFQKEWHAYLAACIGLTLQWVCVCVCVCVCMYVWQPFIIILRNFWAALQTKEGGEVRREGGMEKERVCLRKNNKLPLIWLLAHPAFLSLSVSLPQIA